MLHRRFPLHGSSGGNAVNDTGRKINGRTGRGRNIGFAIYGLNASSCICQRQCTGAVGGCGRCTCGLNGGITNLRDRTTVQMECRTAVAAGDIQGTVVNQSHRTAGEI